MARVVRSFLLFAILLVSFAFTTSCGGGREGLKPLKPEDGLRPQDAEQRGGTSVLAPKGFANPGSTAWKSLKTQEAGIDLSLLRAGDRLRIDVYALGIKEADLSGSFPVSEDGSIAFGSRGQIEVQGQSLNHVKSLLEAALDGYLNKVTVNLAVESFAPREAIIQSSDGVRTVVALGQARSLLAALARAGWHPSAGIETSAILIRGNSTRQINLVNEEATLTEANVELNPGDIVFLKPVGHITMSGQVSLPQSVRVKSDGRINVFEAITLSGGLTADADPRNVRILDDDGRVQMLDLESVLQGRGKGDHFVYSGQTVFVSEFENYAYYAFGMIEARNGLYESKTPLTLMQLVALAGLQKFGARSEAAVLVRGYPHAPNAYKVDIDAILDGAAEGNIILKRGDVLLVPETGLSHAIRVANAILSPIFGATRGLGATAEAADDISNMGNDND